MELKIITPSEKREGAGATVKRLFPTSEIESLDPFVLFDEFFVQPDVGFPEHPHGGFEAITYMVKGSFRHKDNMGNDEMVSKGGIQKFTAGKGIVHSEMPGDEMSQGFQLWVNLPKEKKDIQPSYQKLTSDKVHETQEKGINIRHVVGTYYPIEFETPIEYLDIHMEEGSLGSIPINSGFEGFVYIYQGKVKVQEQVIEKGRAAILKDMTELTIKAVEDSKLVVITGKPLSEPINLQGSFVK